MRYRIELVTQGQVEEVLETITLEAATVREAEAKAHALFEDATAPSSAEGFRIIELGRMNEVSPMDTRRLEPAPRGERSPREVAHFYAGVLSPPER
jgi:hypothetical protein